MIGTPVTLESNRYVYRCAECGLLDAAERSDRLTCSARCRTRAHRNGGLASLRRLADTPCGQVTPGSILQCQAVEVLRPDLAERMARGEKTLDDVRGEIWLSFCQRVEAARKAMADALEVRP